MMPKREFGESYGIAELAVAGAMKTLVNLGLINFKEKVEPEWCGWCHGDALMNAFYIARWACQCAYNCGYKKCNSKVSKEEYKRGLVKSA